MTRVIVVGLLSLVMISFFVSQIINQLRSGKVRPRGSRVYKTRSENPVWYWSSIGSEIAAIVIFLSAFVLAILRLK